MKALDRFHLSEVDFAAAEEAGEVRAVVHSHPDRAATPSMADRYGCDRSQLPWVIVSWPAAGMVTLQPGDATVPLIGREFAHGVADCYTAIQDFFALHQITLPDFDRHGEWWLRGENLYEDNVRSAGFEPVPLDAPLQPGDVLFMKIRAPVTNHGAVYLGDNVIYHHLIDRLAEKTVYGQFYRRCLVSVWRHTQWQPSDYMAI